VIWGHPFKYLGIPIHHKKFRSSDWKEVEERFQKRSVGGLLVLMNFNSFLAICQCLCYLSLRFLVVSLKDYITIDFNSFGKSDGHKKT
jgi:hypothetical protein